MRRRNHRPRCAGEGAMTARTAEAAMAGSFPWHLHAQHPPRLPTGTVPILDTIELRNLRRAPAVPGPAASGPAREGNHASREREVGVHGVGACRWRRGSVSFCPSRHRPGRGVPRFRHTARLVACNSQSTRMSGSCSLRGNRYRGSKRGSRRRVISRILRATERSRPADRHGGLPRSKLLSAGNGLAVRINWPRPEEASQCGT